MNLTVARHMTDCVLSVRHGESVSLCERGDCVLSVRHGESVTASVEEVIVF